MPFMFNAGFRGHMIPILRCGHVKMLFKYGTKPIEYDFISSACCHILLAIIMGGTLCPAGAYAQTTATPLTQEYFLQQVANEDLLIKINSFEAEFESKLTA